MLAWLWRAWAFTICLLFVIVDGKCCNKKVVPGVSSKAGTYILVSDSNSLPDFCLDGCVYTKEDDPLPGSNYCFKKGILNTTCSGEGCGVGNIEGWIEKYFERECSMKFNSYLTVDIYSQYQFDPCPMTNVVYPIADASVALYENPSCEGSPVEKENTESSSSYSVQASFLIRIQSKKPWSIFVISDGFKNKCKTIGKLIPFTNNGKVIYIEKEKNEKLIQSVSLNFTFEINNKILSDVFVQGNPKSCGNSAKKSNTEKKIKQKQLNLKKKNIKEKENVDYYFFKQNQVPAPLPLPIPVPVPFPSPIPIPVTIPSPIPIPWNGIPTPIPVIIPFPPIPWPGQEPISPVPLPLPIPIPVPFPSPIPIPVTIPSPIPIQVPLPIPVSVPWPEYIPIPVPIPSGYGYGYGSGYPGSGYNYQCSPTCSYSSWNTDPDTISCQCKGVIGGGLNFTNITLPNEQTPEAKAKMQGSIYWYTNPISPAFGQPMFFTVFAEFNRRNSTHSTHIRVCDSNLTVYIQSKNSQRKVMKTVPCFEPQIALPSLSSPTFPPFPFPGGFAPGITATPDNEEPFSEVDGVLIWGNADRYWILGCMPEDSLDKFITLNVDFFTSKDPTDTPEFCGCLLDTMQNGNTEADKKQVKDCYMKALAGGPYTEYNYIPFKKKELEKKKEELKLSPNFEPRNNAKLPNKKQGKLRSFNTVQYQQKSMRNLKISGQNKKENLRFTNENMNYENNFHGEHLLEDELNMRFEGDTD